MQNGENMSDNEAEQEGNPPSALAGAEERPAITQPQVVLPNIRPVANFQVTPPEKFAFKPENWLKWIQRFERFRKATGLDKQTGENQVNTLIYTMGFFLNKRPISSSHSNSPPNKRRIMKK